jgi:8-oxo-dGTP pyrophosphatase MutT (NUDIX family)
MPFMTYPRLTEGLIQRLVQALGGPLPGAAAHRAMDVTPPPVRNRLREGPPRKGAVLALLYPAAGQLYLALTKRNARLRHHGGQVSLPGGAWEPLDASLWHTALREAVEEIGIVPDRVRRLGELTPIQVPASGYVVHPFVAYSDERPSFCLQEAEVEALIELPLGALLAPDDRGVEEWQLSDRVARVPFYRSGQVVIWGATAAILSELEALLRSIVA